MEKLWLELVGLATKPGIYALENRKNKKVLVFRSRNPLLYLNTLISKHVAVKNKSDVWSDKRKLKLIVLETDVLDHNSFYYWCQKYKSEGWGFYSQCRVPQLILHTKVDFRIGYMVELRDRGYRSFTVGVFDTAEDAENWINEAYPGGIVNRIVFANNDLTKKYLK